VGQPLDDLPEVLLWELLLGDHLASPSAASCWLARNLTTFLSDVHNAAQVQSPSTLHKAENWVPPFSAFQTSVRASCSSVPRASASARGQLSSRRRSLLSSVMPSAATASNSGARSFQVLPGFNRNEGVRTVSTGAGLRVATKR